MAIFIWILLPFCLPLFGLILLAKKPGFLGIMLLLFLMALCCQLIEDTTGKPSEVAIGDFLTEGIALPIFEFVGPFCIQFQLPLLLISIGAIVVSIIAGCVKRAGASPAGRRTP